jgi:glycosyltransferase involved in cell wall biosynthesis
MLKYKIEFSIKEVCEMNSPKISVIIPIYNTEKYLRQCLDSVVNQTLKDIEIICINDGSTDNSLQILNEYVTKDTRMKIINSKNGGSCGSRNAGLNIVKSDYIMFVDSDDWIQLNTLEFF